MRKLLVAAMFAGAVAMPGGAALADHCFDGVPPNFPDPNCDWIHDCDFNTVAQEDLTGGQDTFTGVARGVVYSPAPGQAVSVRCYVTVDGTEVATTPVGSGTNAATTAGQVTYTASDTQDVDLCVEWTGATGGTQCFETTTTQVPPQEVIDLIIFVTSIPDPLICPIIGGLSPGVPGVVDIDAEGDVAIAGEPFWDCPPYGS